MCMDVCQCTLCIQCTWRLGEGRLPGIGYGNLRAAMSVQGTEPGFPKEQPVLIKAEPSARCWRHMPLIPAL